jgi:hypothetical protein
MRHGFTKRVSVLTGTPGYASVVPGLDGYTTYITKITLSITTHVAGDRYLFDDDGEGATQVAAHTDAAAGAGVLDVVEWPFGTYGTPLSLGSNLDISHSGAGVAVAVIEGFYLPTGTAWSAVLTYAQQVVADGAIAYWRLGEPSGTNAADGSGNGRVGVYVGTPTLGVAGAITGDTGVTFDGVDDEITIASSALHLTDGPLSVEAWVKIGTGTSDGGIFCPTLAGYTSGYALTWHTGTALFFYIGSGVNGATVACSSAGWHHVVGTWDGTTDANSMKIYLDGVLGGQRTSTIDTIAATAYIIGRGNTRFNGSIDDVAVYTTVLTPAQVLDHYKARL